MSHSAKKCKRGDPLDFINIYSVAKYQKTRKGDSFETLKIFRKKVAQCQKNRNGDPLVSSGFVGYVKRLKMKGGTLCTKFALAGLGLSELISFCKKWYIRDEVCGLTKKKRKKTSHCKSRALFIRKAPTKIPLLEINFPSINFRGPLLC